MDFKELTGRENKPLQRVSQEEEIFVHSNLLPSLKTLQEEARQAGIEIAVASGHRSFERQLTIWNAKASGKRKLLDRQERVVDFEKASEEEILEAILTWSAIPGASRHHWGTEIDIYDAAVKERSEVNLTQEECATDFKNLYQWLNSNLKRFPFHRPYAEDLGGVAIEPWHLSFTPLSSQFESLYTFDVFKENISQSEILLKDSVERSLEDIYERYVINVQSPPLKVGDKMTPKLLRKDF